MIGEAPDPRPLGSGIHLIPVPLPFRRPSWVNCYALESDDGVVLIDCGCDWEPGHEALHTGLKSIGLGEVPITTLVVSHLHPDHVGMAGRMKQEHDLQFVMHARAASRMGRYNDTPAFAARERELARVHGVPASYLPTITPSSERPSFMPQLPGPDAAVGDGDRIPLAGDRFLEVLHTPGHEPSHICLRDSLTGVVFSGDLVLPRITPVVPYDEEYDDVLDDFLGSLRRLLELRIHLTYPAHGSLIERGEARVEQLILHHLRRLSEMEKRIAATAMTAWKMVGVTFRPNLSPEDQRLALRETVSHLEHLRLASRIRREDRDGVFWYRH